MSLLSLRKIAVLLVLLQASSLYSQGLPIVGFGDPANYKIDTFAVPGSSGLDLHWFGGIRFGDWTGSNVMRIENGNVGVGVLNPTSKFQVSNSFNTDTNEVIASFTRAVGNTGGSSIVRFGYHNTCDLEVNSGYSSTGHRLGGYFDLNITNNHPGGDHGGINFVTNSSVKMAINVNGNVGIGTVNPGSKLTVAGNIHAQEVKVTARAGEVPDYVFANDYKLKSLEEVEAYIKLNKHLPEIPSAKEIESNGLMLAEMNLNLLKKMEEMTLYMIEMKKENLVMKEKQRQLEETVQELKKIVN
ncbi:tail fiber protein [Flavobacterium sp. N502536]|uniref:tail fiber protein n=1 Tax=Flavobacterium sp. N502536 TaxID=2986837 RepID=UPI0022224222|nr:tail fiber protein [Flavobacterium sp. N502536]